MMTPKADLMNSWPMQILASIGSAMFGFLYGFFLALQGAAFGGAGHGTTLFYFVGTSPYNVGPFLWPIVWGLVPFLRRRWVASIVVLALVIHYFGISEFWRIEDYPMDGLRKTLFSTPGA